MNHNFGIGLGSAGLHGNASRHRVFTYVNLSRLWSRKTKYQGPRLEGDTVNVTSQFTGLCGIVVAWFGHGSAVPQGRPPSTNVCGWSRENPTWSMKDIPMKLPEYWNRSVATPDGLGCTTWINKMVRSLVLLELLGFVHLHKFKTKMYVCACFRFALCKWKKHCVGCNFISLGDQPPDLHPEIKRGNYRAGHLLEQLQTPQQP